MKDQIAVVTGSNGFIGSHLTTYLQGKDITVIPIKRETLENADALRNALVTAEPDYIFHLSAYGNQSTQKSITQMVQSNYINLLALLEATRDIPYKAFINFGTSSEYGEKEHPMKENDSLDSNSFYGVTKAAGTLYARAFAKQFVKPIVTIRPFSVYGPREAQFRFIPTVIKSIMQQKPFNLEPTATHDWIYVADVLLGIQRVVDNVDKLSGQVVNIGTGKMFTNREVVELLEMIIEKKASYVEVSNIRPDHSFHWVADNTKLIELGWKQQYSLTEGLLETYEYYKHIFGNYCLS